MKTYEKWYCGVLYGHLFLKALFADINSVDITGYYACIDFVIL